MRKLLLIITLVSVANAAIADDVQTQLKKCDDALNACKTYVSDLSDENNILTQEVEALKKERDEALQQAASEAKSAPLLPGWAWAVMGVAAGAMAATALHH